MDAMATVGAQSPAPRDPVTFACPRCGETWPAAVDRWRCACGAPLLPVMPRFDPEAIETQDRSVWRYRAMLPVPAGARALTLGEGGTPFLLASVVGLSIWLKLEYLQPSGSYKDRGAAVLASALAHAGVAEAVEDSSGNAGASLAAYLTGSNIPLHLYAPATTPPAKLRQALAHNALVDTSARTRAEATRCAQAAISETTVYASHAYSPYFLAGLMTLAWEMWEGLGRTAPGNLIVPVGHGVLLLALYEGFRLLEEAGLIARLPRLFGVQARACAPIYEAFIRGARDVAAVPSSPTAAGGLQIDLPPRGPEVLAAVRATRGTIINVSEEEIQRGQSLAANLGWFVEPSAAAAVAGLMKLDKIIEPGESVVVPLTGSGLKG